MQRKQSVFILILTLVVALVLPVFVGYSINSVNKSVTKACFNDLAISCKQLAAEFYRTTDVDRTILTAMATIIADDDQHSDAQICEIMSSYNSSASYLNYVEMLRPDNTILDSDGTVRDVSGKFDFKKEVEKGAYISGISQSTLYTDEKVVRNAVPVKKDGEIIYMLYGVVRLSQLPEEYKTNIYKGNAYVYLEDGDTGDFMLDTWHKTLGNFKDVSNRKTLPGYSFEEVEDNLSRGISGNIGFISHTTGSILYMHYEPVGVNNWNVIITVEKQYAMQESEEISSSLYLMAAVIGIIMLIYMFCVLICLLKAYRHVRKIGMEDQTTGLKNRNAYDAFVLENQERIFPSIMCTYIDANGLHEVNNQYGHKAGDQMLQTIADALKTEFNTSAIYRIGGDEFVVYCESDDSERCKARMKKVNDSIESHDYHISYGTVCRKDERGVNRVTKEADQKMLEHKQIYYAEHDRRKSRE